MGCRRPSGSESTQDRGSPAPLKAPVPCGLRRSGVAGPDGDPLGIVIEKRYRVGPVTAARRRRLDQVTPYSRVLNPARPSSIVSVTTSGRFNHGTLRYLERILYVSCWSESPWQTVVEILHITDPVVFDHVPGAS